MWHEARKQERKIRGMMVDYKKRSERRRLYYHRIRADPTQFLRLQGASCKIYVEEDAAEIESAASALMPWQGNRSNMIDRFDVRANLDIIPEPGNFLISSELDENAVVDQKCQYERWRTLATNDLVGLGEEECLAQIAEDESAVLAKITKKSKSAGGAKIGFSYEANNVESSSDSEDSENETKEFLSTDPDLDITFDVRELDPENKSKLNEIAAESYAIPDFTRLHIEDKVESEMREFEIREEQNRAERVAKLSKTERRKEKEERRKCKEVPPHMRVDDPYRNPHSRRSSSRRRDESDSSSDEEKTVQNIEISSARSNTYRNVKSIQKPAKVALPVFLQPKSTTAGLTNLVAARKQLLSKTEDTFDFGLGSSEPVEPSKDMTETKPSVNNQSHSKSPDRPRSRRSRSRRSRSRSSSRGKSDSRSRTRSRNQSRSSRSRSRSRGRSRSRSRGRSRSRSRGRSRSRSRDRKYSSASSRHRSRSRSRGRSDRTSSPRRKVSPKRDARSKSPETRPKANELPLKKSDSLKTLKPHERLKLKLQSQLKKRQRDEKRKEQAQIEAKEQEAFERAEELRVLKRQMWEKEEEEYWKKREEEEREYQKKKAEEKAKKAEESNGEKSRSRSGSRRRHRTRSRSREKSAEHRSSKRSKSQADDDSASESTKKISLVPEYEGVDRDGASSRSKDRSRDHESRRRGEESRRRGRNESDRERRYSGENKRGEPERSRHSGGGERGHSDCVKRRDEERGRGYSDERTRYHEEPSRDRDRGSYRSSYR